MSVSDSTEVIVVPKAEVIPINQRTGKPFSPVQMKVEKIKPKIEQAIRLWCVGKFLTLQEASAYAGINPNRMTTILNSPAGQAIVTAVRGEQDFAYQNLYQKFIEVVGDAMNHPEPAVALAGANLFAKTQIGTKHKVELSAEDIVQQIMSGTYQKQG